MAAPPPSPSASANFFSLIYPTDVVEYPYTYITFNKYSQVSPITTDFMNGLTNTPILGGALSDISETVGNALSGADTSTVVTPKGHIFLPLPKKINDTQTVIWDEVSGLAMAAGIASSLPFPKTNALVDAGVAGAQLLGAKEGLALNPFLIMLFKSPTFKEFVFNWTFTPANAQESYAVKSIINQFKANMLPTVASGFLYNYPNIATIQFNMPNTTSTNSFLQKFNPAAIAAVDVDYSGGGQPSLKSQGAPSVINLTVAFKEIKLHTASDYTNAQIV